MRVSTAIAAFLLSLPVPAFAESDAVRAAIRDVLSEEGFPVDAAGVAVINEGSQISVTIDLSQQLTAYLASRIADRLSADRPELTAVKVDMKVFGSAEKLSENKTPVAATQWNDALSVPAGVGDAPRVALSHGVERPHPEHLANFVVAETDEAGRMIILKHLEEIEVAGRMSNQIATDNYWREIFARLGYEDVYEPSRETLKTALRAGLKPYKQGKGLNAKVFASLAREAIAPAPEKRVEPLVLVQP